MDGSSIEQTDKDKRWSQMDRLVQAGLKKTERESKMKQTVGAALQGFLSLKALIGSALETIPQAALAWMGVCFTMQVGLSTRLQRLY
jgi:N-terminal domain of NWD NACHT-NTPase